MALSQRILFALLALTLAASMAIAEDHPAPATPVAAADEDLVQKAAPEIAPVISVPAPSTVRLGERLEQHGITTATTLTGLLIGDVSGGMATGGVYNSLGTFDAEADLSKAIGFKNATLHASVYWLHGRSVSGEFVGDAFAVSNVEGFNSVRLYELWAEQRFAGDRLALRVGNQSVDAELAGTEYGAALTNSGFGWPAATGANVVNGGPIYPAPAFGARLAWRPSATWNVAAGVYDGDSFENTVEGPLPSKHGLDWSLGNGQGAFAIGECSHNWQGSEDATGLPGVWKVGVWKHTANFVDNRLDANGVAFSVSGADPAVHAGNQGWYAAFEQKLCHEGADRSQGLGAWVRVGGAPEDRSAFSFAGDAGLHWTGALPGRNEDVLAFGVVSASVSPQAVAAAREQAALLGEPAFDLDYERVFEISYSARVSPRWTVTPDLQRVQHPGTSAATPDAWVAGLRITFE